MGLLGCTDNEDPIALQNKRAYEVINDSGILQSLVNRKNERIGINGISNARLSHPIYLTLVSEISSPEVLGNKVMATSVSEHGDQLFVSFNTQGSVYRGAVLIAERDGSEIEILSQVSFEDVDVNHAVANDEALFMTGSADGVNPSWVGKLDLTNNIMASIPRYNLIVTGTLEEALFQSYTGTSIASTDNSILVAFGTGDGSGVTEFLADELQTVGSFSMSDPRWVLSSANRVFVQNGIPGALSTYENGSVVSSFPVSDADLDSKATFDYVGGYFFVGTGKNGVEIYDENGTRNSVIPLPESGEDLTVNSVAVYGDMIFIASGEKIYVATYSDGTDLNPEIIGQLELGDFESINHIMFQDNYLIVASGLGGVKVIEVDFGDNDNPVSGLLSRDNMRVIYTNSEEPLRDRYADYVLDGDLNTFWHTEWVRTDPEHPHELWIDMGAAHLLTEFRYQSRQWGNFNGTVKDFELYISNDTSSWGQPFYNGSFEKTRDEQSVSFNAVSGQYFRFVSKNEVNNRPWASCSEINFVGTPDSFNE